MPQRSRPTIIDVARIAGVSPTTVSYVLSGPKERAERISEDTRIRVLAAVENVGYVANQSARTLRLRRTNRVLFLGSRITSLYSQVMAQSIAEGLAKHKLALDVQIGTGSDHINRSIRALEQSQADGLIIEAADEHLPKLRDAARRGHAIVAIGPGKPDDTLDIISNDDAPAIKEAMTRVVERGYRTFLLLSLHPDTEEPRIAVAHQQLDALGIPEENITVFHCPHDRVAAHGTAMKLLPRLARPVAVYAGSDVSAIGVLWACISLGLGVPVEVAIIGHGNSPETHITVPPLTSLGPVRSDFRKAADLMASRLKDRSLPGRHISEPYQLSIRGST